MRKGMMENRSRQRESATTREGVAVLQETAGCSLKQNRAALRPVTLSPAFGGPWLGLLSRAAWETTEQKGCEHGHDN